MTNCITDAISQQLHAQYSDLQKQINLLEAGECTPNDVKHKSALLGIYRERDTTFMLRIRRTAGETTPQNLRDLARIMEENAIHHAHFSTRQNIQLHGVPAAHVERSILACNKANMLFRGGGGNTFRNIATSPYTGIAKDCTFDTTPHATAVWDWVFYYEKAFHFCRKFKLGFGSNQHDDSNTGIQDLGFMAVTKNNERGFKVYGGGGMGRGGSLGIVLFDFLPEKEILRVSQAGIDMFHEYGNREVRSKARLRFVLQERGPEEFTKIFMDLYNKADAPDFVHQARSYDADVAALTTFDTPPLETEEYLGWLQRSVIPSQFDNVVSVRLFVCRGNYSAQDLRNFAQILDAVGVPFIRVAIEQDAILPLVHVTALAKLYTLLKEKLPKQATTLGTFEGHVISCIGASSCPIGVLKAPETAVTVATALDTLFQEYQGLVDELYEEVIDAIRIAGCGSSCALNQVAPIGFTGGKKRIDGEVIEVYQVWYGGKMDEDGHLLAETHKDLFVPAKSMSTFVSNLVKEFLEARQDGQDISLRDFMIEKRGSLVVEEYLS